MNPLRPDDVNRERDPLAAYADGDPDAVRAATPREPSTSEWESTRQRIHARLQTPPELEDVSHRGWRAAFWLVAGTALTASAATVAWMVFNPFAPKAPQLAEVAKVQPAPVDGLPIAPPPRESAPDPLAEFAVIPVASSEEVVLHRIPGDGWLPVGTDSLSGAISLATTDDVELDDPDPAWPSVIITPGSAPMIFAAKPR